LCKNGVLFLSLFILCKKKKGWFYKALNGLVSLLTERTTFSQTSATTSGLTQNGTARGTQNNSLGVAKDGADVQTT